VLVVSREVWNSSRWLELAFHSVKKMRDMGTEFNENFVGGWFPAVRVDEELFGVIVFIAVCKKQCSEHSQNFSFGPEVNFGWKQKLSPRPSKER
jgi:hypothetical protein